MLGWRAEVVTEPMRDAKRLFIVRYPGDRSSEVMLHVEPTFQRFDAGEAIPADAGLILPTDMWQAIVACADPAPHGAEVRRLEEALKVEQARVDMILGRAEVRR